MAAITSSEVIWRIGGSEKHFVAVLKARDQTGITLTTQSQQISHGTAGMGANGLT
jgi:hypothetical protein